MSVEDARSISSQWILAQRLSNSEFKCVNLFILVEEYIDR